jgi:hypothetical protein
LHRSSSLRALVAAAALASGCGQGKTGIAYLRSTALDGPCPITQPTHNFPSTCVGVCGVDDLVSLPYTRAHGVAAFEGGSQWSGGDLVAVAWSEEDGSVHRLYFDFGPKRGYGVSATTQAEDQGVGYVIWNEGQRTFGATKVLGALDLQSSAATDSFGRSTNTGVAVASALLTHIAFEGQDASGATQCRVVGLHAANDHERTEPYDPSWLVPNPTALIVAGKAPSFTGDVAPSNALVAPAAAPRDPGGAAPTMTFKQSTSLSGGAEADDGCD